MNVGNGKVGKCDLRMSTELLPLPWTWWVLIGDSGQEARGADGDADRARQLSRV